MGFLLKVIFIEHGNFLKKFFYEAPLVKFYFQKQIDINTASW